MNWITDVLVQGAGHIKPYNGELAVAFVATLLVIYGDAINRTVRIFVKPYPFVLRITAFVLLCTLGYGAVTVWGSGQIRQLMSQIPDIYLPIVVLAAFIVLGVLAERYHKS